MSFFYYLSVPRLFFLHYLRNVFLKLLSHDGYCPGFMNFATGTCWSKFTTLSPFELVETSVKQMSRWSLECDRFLEGNAFSPEEDVKFFDEVHSSPLIPHNFNTVVCG